MNARCYGFMFNYNEVEDILTIEQPEDQLGQYRITLSQYDLVPLKNMLCDLIEEIDEGMFNE